jgi:hypothetical protein
MVIIPHDETKNPNTTLPKILEPYNEAIETEPHNVEIEPISITRMWKYYIEGKNDLGNPSPNKESEDFEENLEKVEKGDVRMENQMNRKVGIWIILMSLIAVALLAGLWAWLSFNSFGIRVFPFSPGAPEFDLTALEFLYIARTVLSTVNIAILSISAMTGFTLPGMIEDRAAWRGA